MKKILILGSEGFIGSHLVSYYLTKGCEVYGCDLFNAPSQHYNYTTVSRLSPELEDIFRQSEYEICINAAGKGSVPYSVEHPVPDFELNSLETIRLLDTIRRISPSCIYFHISSAAVYGNPAKLPVSEADPISPLSPYGWHKLISEHICKEYSSIYGVKTVVIRPFSVYGPGLKKQLLWDLYQKMVQNVSSMELLGTGQETRDFIFIKDLVACVDLLSVKAEKSGQVYNVASGSETCIRTIAEMMADRFGWKGTIRFNQQQRKGDPINWKADISKITNFGFQPGIPITEGISKTVLWLKTLS